MKQVSPTTAFLSRTGSTLTHESALLTTKASRQAIGIGLGRPAAKF